MIKRFEYKKSDIFLGNTSGAPILVPFLPLTVFETQQDMKSVLLLVFFSPSNKKSKIYYIMTNFPLKV